ncbi:MAG: hypothetical protein JWO13_1483 [Acidobacteriales bacterium]|nr:hypothetical protein [Terriglobales bacterium]
MDHLCHRCNSEVTTGTLFCAQCGAPQIRVTSAPAPQESAVQDQPFAESAPVRFDSSSSVPSVAIHWPSALIRAAISAVITVILLNVVVAVTQLPALSLLVVPTGGAFCASLYSRRQQLTSAQGARLGAVTGLFSYFIFAVIVGIEMIYQRDEMFATLQKALKEAAANNPNPQAEVLVQQFMTPAGMATLLTVSAVIFLFIFLLLGALGGSAGAAMSRSAHPDQD